MLIHVIRFLRSWGICSRTLRQLGELSEADLQEIGISRSDIPRIAWERSEA
ncbi:MAG TPA: DUF1127 domain-containing protein [Xanthobacteraceae bacterium]|nr:DUF1127 domain-containing protein [Xanthobacteraceae bacterium]